MRRNDPRIDRVVAIKIITISGASPSESEVYRTRFIREARASGRLSHPGIVTIYDVDADPVSHTPYIVMEYLVHEGAIQQLTQDHSLVMEPVRLGLISPESAEKSKLQNIITRALGPAEIVEPGLDEMIAASDDIFVLASDGLTRVLGDQVILEVVTAAVDVKYACNHLIQLAKEAGCADNITCLLIRDLAIVL